MENPNIRQPKQRRSIEKKEKILHSAFDLICEKEYNSITITEIAGRAKVSPGTLYSYFTDKKAIYLEVYAMYHNQIALPSHEYLQNIKPPFEIKGLVEFTMDSVVQRHIPSKRVHDEFMRLINIDEDFGRLERQLMYDSIEIIIELMDKYNYNVKNSHEKLHIALHIFDIYAHECVYHKTEGLDYTKIKDTILSFVLYMMME